MFFRRIVGTNRRGNAALRMAGVAFGRVSFRENDDAAGACQVACGTQTGYAAADDQEIGIDAVTREQSVILPSE